MSKCKIHNKLKFILPIWALICAILCAVAYRYSFDRDIGYFRAAPLTYIFYVSIVIAIAIAIAAAITHSEKDGANAKGDRRVMAIIMAVAFLFYLVSFALTKRPAYLSVPMCALLIVFAAISVAHFIIVAFSRNAGDSLKIFTGICAVLTPILIATASYFDHSQTLNSPYKLLFEFGCATFALYYVTELRAYTHAPKKKFIIAASGICTTLTLCAGVSKMFEIMYNQTPTLLNISSAILFASMASCSASKLLES